MIDGSEKRNRQLAFELQNSHACEKRSKNRQIYPVFGCSKILGEAGKQEILQQMFRKF